MRWILFLFLIPLLFSYQVNYYYRGYYEEEDVEIPYAFPEINSSYYTTSNIFPHYVYDNGWSVERGNPSYYFGVYLLSKHGKYIICYPISITEDYLIYPDFSIEYHTSMDISHVVSGYWKLKCGLIFAAGTDSLRNALSERYWLHLISLNDELRLDGTNFEYVEANVIFLYDSESDSFTGLDYKNLNLEGEWIVGWVKIKNPDLWKIYGITEEEFSYNKEKFYGALDTVVKAEPKVPYIREEEYNCEIEMKPGIQECSFNPVYKDFSVSCEEVEDKVFSCEVKADNEIYSHPIYYELIQNDEVMKEGCVSENPFEISVDNYGTYTLKVYPCENGEKVEIPDDKIGETTFESKEPSIQDISAEVPNEVDVDQGLNVKVNVKGTKVYLFEEKEMSYEIKDSQDNVVKSGNFKIKDCSESSCEFSVNIPIDFVGRDYKFSISYGSISKEYQGIDFYRRFEIESEIAEIKDIHVIEGDAEYSKVDDFTAILKVFSFPTKLNVTGKTCFGEENVTVEISEDSEDTIVIFERGDYFVDVDVPEKLYYWTKYKIKVSSNYCWLIELPNGTKIDGKNSTEIEIFLDESWPVGEAKFLFCLGRSCEERSVEIFANTTILSELPLRSVESTEADVTRVSDTRWRLYYNRDSIQVRLYPKPKEYNSITVVIYKENSTVFLPVSEFQYIGFEKVRILDYDKTSKVSSWVEFKIETTGDSIIYCDWGEGKNISVEGSIENVTVSLKGPKDPGSYKCVVYLKKYPDIYDEVSLKFYEEIEIVGNVIIRKITGKDLECEIEGKRAICRAFKKKVSVTVYPIEGYSPKSYIFEAGESYFIKFEESIGKIEVGEEKGPVIRRILGLEEIMERVRVCEGSKLEKLIKEVERGNYSVIEEIKEILNKGEWVNYSVKILSVGPVVAEFSVKVHCMPLDGRAEVFLESEDDINKIIVELPNGTEVEEKGKKIRFSVPIEDLSEYLTKIKIHAFKEEERRSFIDMLREIIRAILSFFGL